MKNERIFIPLTIGAAVIGIWAALRKQPQQTIVTKGGINLPGIAPLQQTLYDPVGLPYSDYGPTATGGGASHGQNRDYQNAVQNNPLSVGPAQLNINLNAVTDPLAYLNFNVAPMLDAPKRATFAAESDYTATGGKSAGCGCGGGCNGASRRVRDAMAGCGQNINPRFLDGHGGCVTTRPIVGVSPQTDANTRYIAASYDYSVSAAKSDYGIMDAGTVLPIAAGGF